MHSLDEKYTRTAMLLHWVIALLMLFQFGLGWVMEDLPKGPDRTWNFALHKSIGITLFGLVIVRLLWRLTHQPPALPGVMKPWRQRLVQATHRAFYVLIILQPILGYLSSSFSGYKTQYFGIPLPHWGWKHEALNGYFSELHELNASLLMILIIAHVIGALSHLLTRGDRLFNRMWS